MATTSRCRVATSHVWLAELVTGPQPTGGSPSRGIRERPAGARRGSSSTSSSTSPTGRPGSWSMWTSSMLTSLAPASANSRASSPGWSGTETKTDARRPRRARRACPGSRGCRPRPRSRISPSAARSPRRRPRRSGRRAGRGPRSSRPATAAAFPVTICCQSAGSPPAIRVTSRTPWPRARGGRSGASASRPATSDGQQVRAGARSGRRPGRAPPGSAVRGSAPHSRASSSTAAVAAARRSARAGVTAHGRPSNSVGAGRQRAGPLAARHRVAADVPLDARRRPSSARSGAGLDAADVGDDGVGRRERPGDLGADVVGRHGDHDQLPAGSTGVRTAGAEPAGGAEVLGRCGR